VSLRPIVLAVLVCASLVSQISAAQVDRDLDGTWEGVLPVVYSYGIPEDHVPPDAQMHVRLRIRGRNVRLAVSLGDSPGPPDYERFRITRFESSAIVYLGENAEDWVDTWFFTLARKDADTLLAFGWRVLNNTNLAANRDDARWAWGLMGDLHRNRSR